MRIAGITKSSLIDFPQKASTVVFLGGCNFRCGYCHNPELLVFSKKEGLSPDRIDLEELVSFLKVRRRFIDGVCISGGEPTLTRELPNLIDLIKGLDLAVKLDTNGSNPKMLKELLTEKLIDYVAMDIKGPAGKYGDITRCPVDINAIKASAEILTDEHNSNRITCEFRTTVCRELLTGEDIKKMVGEYSHHPPWFLQRFTNPGKILDEKGTYTAYSLDEMKALGEEVCVSVR